ncbi:F0F1 ATP synthase subunit delta [Streptococcus varani]|uniref:ATP synthase subunit delta n=2 Tax=Streptococcus varani TaxID=1608583 RepID=A0A0E4H8S1_9STRE|nr:F0F1 ATP synthase subunit delta [Streptococcus varani]
MGVREANIVHKYAYNFVESISYRDDIWRVYDEVSRIVSIIHNTKLNRILQSPTTSKQDKESFLRNLRQSEYRFVNDLIERLIQDENYDLVLPTLEDVLLKISKSQNEYDMVVTSFQALTEQQKERITAIAQERFSVKIHNVIEEIDKEILGGFIVNVNHRVIDTSVRTQLGDIRKKL